MTDQSNAGSTAGPADQTKRWLWRALVLSLSINLLVAGIFIGAKWSHGSRHTHLARGHGLLGFTQSLDGERRELFQNLAKSHRERRRALRNEVRSKQRSAIELLKAVPFNRDLFVAALDETLKERMNVRRELTEQFIAMIDQLTDEERRAYAEWYEERHEHKLH